jgi:hypothetical protein
MLKHKRASMSDLRAKAAAATKLVEIIHEFRDDNLPCVAFKYKTRSLALWWTDSLVVGALRYSDSVMAEPIITELLATIDRSSDDELTEGIDTEMGSLQIYPTPEDTLDA